MGIAATASRAERSTIFLGVEGSGRSNARRGVRSRSGFPRREDLADRRRQLRSPSIDDPVKPPNDVPNPNGPGIGRRKTADIAGRNAWKSRMTRSLPHGASNCKLDVILFKERTCTKRTFNGESFRHRRCFASLRMSGVVPDSSHPSLPTETGRFSSSMNGGAVVEPDCP